VFQKGTLGDLSDQVAALEQTWQMTAKTTGSG